ncbi:dnaB domain protein [Mycobacteroides abscessus subsp. bolletii]|uniref:hypothetical protein n=1 Tax=Mycobacteroides abscessus TaxID=36809 RepID=UPI0009A73506|nr:hypothetical protein [Mycobacteroides abscessus]SKR94469.1 dnaB domain protein [Mycobacteroides abscessus subsp. bolletii]SKS03118.1 dnaB domain protein [Mycobacteroides abscessus subsp. bolletii]DAZ90102.1 TPA_asm: Cas4 family exonuclease [Mycobacterium phage prophiFVLQ01-1]
MTADDIFDGPMKPAPDTTPKRDHFGVYRNGNNQPLIMTPEGDKRVAYQRTTLFIDHLEDGSSDGLRIWQERLTLEGLIKSPELRAELMAWNGELRVLSDIAKRAARLAGRDEKQEWGSMMHQVTDAMDKGDMMPREWWNENTKALEPVPSEARRDADAYRIATRCLEHELAEHMHVYDDYKVAGTPDRRSTYRVRGKVQGRPKIVDLKTGTLHPRMVEAQLAMYAHSTPYDVINEARQDFGPVDLKRGIVVHLPMKQATCELHWADLTKGWADCKVAREKHQKGLRRKLTALGRIVELGPDIPLTDRISLACNVEALRDVWAEAAKREELTDGFKDAIKARLAHLGAA